MTNTDNSVSHHSDPWALNRFVTAQNKVYQQVVQELNNGCKRSHWMWYIFPQVDGLAQSSTSKYYAIKSLDEAIAYFNHPILGARLIECTNLVQQIEDKAVSEIFAYPDNLKLQSSMTLFAEITNEPVFTRILDRYFQSQPDQKTLQLLNKIKATKQ